MHSTTARRLLLSSLVGIALVVVGCAHYEQKQPMAERGTVLLTWEVAPERVPANHCGWAEQIAKGHWLISFRRAYDFNHVCWAHELGHAFGGSHQ
jgi:hypothetical protein